MPKYDYVVGLLLPMFFKCFYKIMEHCLTNEYKNTHSEDLPLYLVHIVPIPQNKVYKYQLKILTVYEES